MTAPLLVFAWGNPSRGDDALGPLFATRLRAALESDGNDRVEILEDFQLQIEHALDLVGRQRVLFVDASMGCAAPFEAHGLEPAAEVGADSHALSPQAVMKVYRDLHGCDAPPCTLLAVRGEGFELGQALSAPAALHLEAALCWGRSWVDAP